MRLLALAFIIVAACKAREAAPKRVVTAPEAKAFAEMFATMVKPCDEAKVADVIDREAMAAKFTTRTTMPDAQQIAQELANAPIGAKILCSSMRGIDDYKLLRVQLRDGAPRPIMRRVISDPRSGATVVGYDELELGKSRADGVVRIVDSYSYLQGQWITELLVGNRDALAKSVDYVGYVPEMADTIRKARDLQRQGLNKEALEIVDGLPKAAREYRGVQLIRVRASAGLGPDAYKQALDELATVFPNDPSIAMVQADGAFARGDFDTALRWIDVLDTAIGGDTFQAAHRAMAYLRRGRPGDVELARATIDKAIAAEPTLKRAWEVKLDVALAEKNWAEAVTAMTELEDKHRVTFDDAKLAAQPTVAELIASPEYKEWRAGRKR